MKRFFLMGLLLLAPHLASAGPAQMTRAEIVANAHSGVGYSYWWGRGKWDASAVSSPGSCAGSCPSCSHCPSKTRNGACASALPEYGADCSGYVAKVWQVPGPTAFKTNSHPYSTQHFTCESREWSPIERGTVKQGDAASYRKGGCPGTSGHVLLYDRGDAWGAWTTWEARGCSYGIVNNGGRSVSGYRVIRRTQLVAPAPDADGDGVADTLDNCPNAANAGQGDRDGDGVGDACDNCESAANSDQGDDDSDGWGNTCDNCPGVPNRGQLDSDGDGVGDVCEADRDGDGVIDDDDSCPDVATTAQVDEDGDGVGDACDVCPSVADPEQGDQDDDTVGDACDACPDTADPEQGDRDDDTVGDACDACPDTADPEQADEDADGIGDACAPAANDVQTPEDGGTAGPTPSRTLVAPTGGTATGGCSSAAGTPGAGLILALAALAAARRRR